MSTRHAPAVDGSTTSPVTTLTIGDFVRDLAITGMPAVGRVYLSANGTLGIELILGRTEKGEEITVRTSSLNWLAADLPHAARSAEERLLLSSYAGVTGEAA